MIKKELALWLDNFNNVTVPNLLAKGFKPNATNAREGLANITKELITDIPTVEQILDEVIPTSGYNVPVRIYNPNPEEILPIIIYFHGGGHMAGSVTVYDPICRKIATKTNHIVISVEYRLSPENPYPAGVIDAYNVIKNIYPVLDSRNLKYKKQLSLVGDSGGGALVTSVIMCAQFDTSIQIKNQVLIYPSVDYTMNTESIVTNGVGYLLATSKIKWYFDNYFQNGENRKLASPLFGDFTNKMPQTLVFTAGYCPLKDEGKLYIEKVKETGVYTEFYELENMIHTFMNMEDLCREETEFVYEKMNHFLNR